MTLGFDGKTLNFFALQLTDQGAQLFSQLHIRAQLRRFFRRKAGHVERVGDAARYQIVGRSEEHTSELQSLMRISYAVFCLKKKTKNTITHLKSSIHVEQ